MAKPKAVKQERDAIQLSVAAQEFAKVLFPALTGEDAAFMENEIYDWIDQNQDCLDVKSDAEKVAVGAEIKEAVEGTFKTTQALEKMSQEYAKTLFPELAGDADAMEEAAGEIYDLLDLLDENPEFTEEDIVGDITKAIEATKEVGKPLTPGNVFLMHERMAEKEMFD